MEQELTLLEKCKIIADSIRNKGVFEKFDGKKCNTDNNIRYQVDLSKDSLKDFPESQKIADIFKNSFYNEEEFAQNFTNYFNFIDSHKDINQNCKIDSLLLLLKSCLLNYKTSQIAFDTCPDTALSITLDLINEFTHSNYDDEYIIEKLFLFYRLRNEFRIGRKCKRLLSQLSTDFNFHLLINDKINLDGKYDGNTVYHRIFLLSKLSSIIHLHLLSNFITYSKSETEVKFDQELRSIDDIRVLVNGIKFDKFTPNLVKFNKHISYKRSNSIGSIDDYVILDESEQVLSNLCFTIDNSIGVVVTGPCRNYYIRVLASRLGMDLKDVVNVYTDESTEIKSLIGNWIVGENLGEFDYSFGIISRAAKEGKWLIFDSFIPESILSFLLNINSSHSFFITELNEKVDLHENFQFFILQNESTNFFDRQRCSEQLPIVTICDLTRGVMGKICSSLYPHCHLGFVLNKAHELSDVYDQVELTLDKLLKFSKRIYPYLLQTECKSGVFEVSDFINGLIIYDFYTLFVSKMDNSKLRLEVIANFAKKLNILINTLEDVFIVFNHISHTRDVVEDRSVFEKVLGNNEYNSQVLKMIYSSYVRNEPVLLVGETGTGKTALVQKFAEITGNVLKVYVFSENSDSTDLIGNFIPTNSNSQPEGVIKYKFNQGILIDCIENGYWLLLDEINLSQYDLLYKLCTLLNTIFKKPISSSDEYFDLYEYVNKRVKINRNFRLFACMNPPILKRGDVLRINTGKKQLPPKVLKLFTSIHVDPIDSYNDLLLIAQYYTRNLKMNLNLSELCKFYLKAVEMIRNFELEDGANKLPNFTLRNFVRSIQYIINKLTREFRPIRDVNKLIFDSIQSNFLSTLDEVSIAKIKSILPPELLVHNNTVNGIDNVKYSNDGNYINLYNYWIKMGNPKSTQRNTQSDDGFDEEYVICNNNVKYLVEMVRILSGLKVPILLEGPTAAGKTSLVKYLCKLTNNTCVRINNYDNIDLTEYLGQYHFIDGKLIFEYGLLTVAMKYGYWVILDELNLASSNILECLNRILDDNKEIYLSDTNEVIKCHENFMLFATQNPCDSIYSGRKQLSNSFKNRFIQIYFDEIKSEDLKLILYKRCQLPLSKSEIIVKIYTAIKSLTINSILFNKTQILITIRDLIKLSLRLSNIDASELNSRSYNDIINTYFYILICEKLYNEDEKMVLFKTINQDDKHSSIVNCENLGNESKRRKLVHEVNYVDLLNRSRYVNSTELKCFFAKNGYFWIDGYTDRIVYLITEAVFNKEHVLLVGETGIGKTTIVQLLSQYLNSKLNIFNCNLNTDVVDFIGGIYPTTSHSDLNSEAKEKSRIEYKWRNGELVNSMIEGSWFLFDEINLIQDSILEKINSILEFKSYILLNSITSVGKSVDMNHVYSHEKFRVFATMNPGNDFGKKELSPSIANRFTTIYIPNINLYDFNLLHNIVSHHNKSHTVEHWVIYSIIDIIKLLSNEVNGTDLKAGMGVISIRNVLAWTSYYFNIVKKGDEIKVFIDGLYIAILNSYTLPQFDPETFHKIINTHITFEGSGFASEDERRIIDDVEKCVLNIRNTSILLQGNPGIGKTYNVYKLARKFNQKLIRINLNEYTDLLDLLGTFVPTSNNSKSSLPSMKFVYKNGPLLDAVINGYWVLLDELNLASSEVLEGLNSILDYRRDIYVPQINKVYKCHENFQLFATQNMPNTNFRKNLPKSLLNRFILFTVHDFTFMDYYQIIEAKFNSSPELITKYINLVFSLNSHFQIEPGNNLSVGNNENLFNVRDLINIFKLMEKHDEATAVNVTIKYKINRLNPTIDKLLQNCKNYYPNILYKFTNNFSDLPLDPSSVIDNSDIYNTLIILYQNMNKSILFTYNNSIQERHINTIIHNFNTLVNQYQLYDDQIEVSVLNLYQENVVNDIIGVYEQVNLTFTFNQISQLFYKFVNKLRNSQVYHDFIKQHTGKQVDLEQYIYQLCNFIKPQFENDHLFTKLYSNLMVYIDNVRENRGNLVDFKWIDNVLIDCIQGGNWLIINNIHLINAKLLDRLNSLLEEDNPGTFYINECGYHREVKVHPNFRIFFTINDSFLHKISNAFLNRCVQLNLNNYKLIHTIPSLLIKKAFNNITHLVHDIYVYEVYNIINIIKVHYPNIFSLSLSIDYIITLAVLYIVLNKLYGINLLFLKYFINFYEEDLKFTFNHIITNYYSTLEDVEPVLDTGNAVLSGLNYENEYYQLFKAFIQTLHTVTPSQIPLAQFLDVKLITLYNNMIHKFNLSCNEVLNEIQKFELDSNVDGTCMVLDEKVDLDLYSVLWYVYKWYTSGLNEDFYKNMVVLLTKSMVREFRLSVDLVGYEDLYYIYFLNSHNVMNDEVRLDRNYIIYKTLRRYNVNWDKIDLNIVQLVQEYDINYNLQTPDVFPSYSSNCDELILLIYHKLYQMTMSLYHNYLSPNSKSNDYNLVNSLNEVTEWLRKCNLQGSREMMEIAQDINFYLVTNNFKYLSNLLNYIFIYTPLLHANSNNILYHLNLLVKIKDPSNETDYEILSHYFNYITNNTNIDKDIIKLLTTNYYHDTRLDNVVIFFIYLLSNNDYINYYLDDSEQITTQLILDTYNKVCNDNISGKLDNLCFKNQSSHDLAHNIYHQLINDDLQLDKLWLNLVNFMLSIIPNVNHTLNSLRYSYQNYFEWYKTFEFQQILNTFNILDSLSIGYVIDHSLDICEKKQYNNVGVEVGLISLIYNFINDYNYLKSTSLNAQSIFNFISHVNSKYKDIEQVTSYPISVLHSLLYYLTTSPTWNIKVYKFGYNINIDRLMDDKFMVRLLRDNHQLIQHYIYVNNYIWTCTNTQTYCTNNYYILLLIVSYVQKLIKHGGESATEFKYNRLQKYLLSLTEDVNDDADEEPDIDLFNSEVIRLLLSDSQEDEKNSYFVLLCLYFIKLSGYKLDEKFNDVTLYSFLNLYNTHFTIHNEILNSIQQTLGILSSVLSEMELGEDNILVENIRENIKGFMENKGDLNKLLRQVNDIIEIYQENDTTKLVQVQRQLKVIIAKMKLKPNDPKTFIEDLKVILFNNLFNNIILLLTPLVRNTNTSNTNHSGSEGVMVFEKIIRYLFQSNILNALVIDKIFEIIINLSSNTEFTLLLKHSSNFLKSYRVQVANYVNKVMANDENSVKSNLKIIINKSVNDLIVNSVDVQVYINNELNTLNLDQFNPLDEGQELLFMISTNYQFILSNHKTINESEYKRIISILVNKLQSHYQFKHISNKSITLYQNVLKYNYNFAKTLIHLPTKANYYYNALNLIYNISHIQDNASQDSVNNYNVNLFKTMIQDNYKLLNIIDKLHSLIIQNPPTFTPVKQHDDRDLVMCVRQYNLTTEDKLSMSNLDLNLIKQGKSNNLLLHNIYKLSRSARLNNELVAECDDFCLNLEIFYNLIRFIYIFLLLPSCNNEEMEKEGDGVDYKLDGVGLDNEVGLKNISDSLNRDDLNENQEELENSKDEIGEDLDEDGGNLDVDDNIDTNLEDFNDDQLVDDTDVEQGDEQKGELDDKDMDGEDFDSEPDLNSADFKEDLEEAEDHEPFDDGDQTIQEQLQDDVQNLEECIQDEIEEYLNTLQSENELDEDEDTVDSQKQDEEQLVDEHQSKEMAEDDGDVDDKMDLDEKTTDHSNSKALNSQDPGQDGIHPNQDLKDMEIIDRPDQESAEKSSLYDDSNIDSEFSENMRLGTGTGMDNINEVDSVNPQLTRENSVKNELAQDMSKLHVDSPQPNNLQEKLNTINIQEIINNHENQILINNLLYQLNIVLDNNKSSGLKGYYKNGKKLSIKRLILFIATNYQNDKIWLKRLKKEQRNYFIQLAIDNTKSMSNISSVTLKTIYIIYQALYKLNLTTLNIIKYGAFKSEVILDKSRYNIETSLSKLTFDEESKYSYENGLINLFEFILTQHDFILSENKILIIITDGKFNKNKIRAYVTQMVENKVLPLLIILDPKITSMKSIKSDPNGQIVMENYLDNFPFQYYSIVDNINTLPRIISDLLR